MDRFAIILFATVIGLNILFITIKNLIKKEKKKMNQFDKKDLQTFTGVVQVSKQDRPYILDTNTNKTYDLPQRTSKGVDIAETYNGKQVSIRGWELPPKNMGNGNKFNKLCLFHIKETGGA